LHHVPAHARRITGAKEICIRFSAQKSASTSQRRGAENAEVAEEDLENGELDALSAEDGAEALRWCHTDGQRRCIASRFASFAGDYLLPIISFPIFLCELRVLCASASGVDLDIASGIGLDSRSYPS